MLEWEEIWSEFDETYCCKHLIGDEEEYCQSNTYQMYGTHPPYKH